MPAKPSFSRKDNRKIDTQVSHTSSYTSSMGRRVQIEVLESKMPISSQGFVFWGSELRSQNTLVRYTHKSVIIPTIGDPFQPEERLVVKGL